MVGVIVGVCVTGGVTLIDTDGVIDFETEGVKLVDGVSEIVGVTLIEVVTDGVNDIAGDGDGVKLIETDGV